MEEQREADKPDRKTLKAWRRLWLHRSTSERLAREAERLASRLAVGDERGKGEDQRRFIRQTPAEM